MKSILHRSHPLLVALALLAAPALWSCNSETAFAKAQREQLERQRVIDNDTIQSYLRRNNYLSIARQTSSGLYVVPLREGQGTPVTAGKQVTIKYIGRYLGVGEFYRGNASYAPGMVFDNSSENRSDCGCAVFIGGSGAIPGFNEGLLLMRQGDRKLLLIPSRLAYGPGGQPNGNNSFAIPPDATLAFDVEILSVSQ